MLAGMGTAGTGPTLLVEARAPRRPCGMPARRRHYDAAAARTAARANLVIEERAPSSAPLLARLAKVKGVIPRIFLRLYQTDTGQSTNTLVLLNYRAESLRRGDVDPSWTLDQVTFTAPSRANNAETKKAKAKAAKAAK